MHKLILVFCFCSLTGCVAIIEHETNRTALTCNARWHDYVYVTSKEEGKAVLFYGMVLDIKKSREPEDRPWLAEGIMWSIVLWPFVAADLPFSFLAESTVFRKASLEKYKQGMEICKEELNEDN